MARTSLHDCFVGQKAERQKERMARVKRAPKGASAIDAERVM